MSEFLNIYDNLEMVSNEIMRNSEVLKIISYDIMIIENMKNDIGVFLVSILLLCENNN